MVSLKAVQIPGTQGRNRDDFRKGVLLAEPLDVRQELVRIRHPIDLVDDQYHRAFQVGQLLKNMGIALIPEIALDHENHQIHIPERAVVASRFI